MIATATVSPPMLARNVTHFVRLLRGAGMPLAPSRAVDAIEAMGHVDIGRRDDVKAALAALLVLLVIIHQATGWGEGGWVDMLIYAVAVTVVWSGIDYVITWSRCARDAGTSSSG